MIEIAFLVILEIFTVCAKFVWNGIYWCFRIIFWLICAYCMVIADIALIILFLIIFALCRLCHFQAPVLQRKYILFYPSWNK